VKLLLDTHALLWWWQGNPRLSSVARELIGDPKSEVLVSAASAWEIATKVRIGKLREAVRLCGRFKEGLEDQGFQPLSIAVEHAVRAGRLSEAHRDPLDRILAAQALCEGLAIVTNDQKIKSFGVQTIW
jgi:PIN domain nuclease of toxin-antitoxin system